MSTNKIQTGIRFEPELLYKIGFVAKQNMRSLNAQLEFWQKVVLMNMKRTTVKLQLMKTRFINSYY